VLGGETITSKFTLLLQRTLFKQNLTATKKECDMKWHRLSITRQELNDGIIDPLIEMDDDSKKESPDKISWMEKYHHAIWRKEHTEHIHFYFSQSVLHYFRVVLPENKVVSCEKPNREDVELYRGDEKSTELLNDDISI
jgi:hypothetical protein